jgi:polysaccharide deacetylase family protein (PEP-CTERM system associated)
MEMLNALTVDVEDWYHVCAVDEYLPQSKWDEYENRVNRNTEKVLALLERYGVRVTFFVLGYVAEHNPDLVRKVYEAGHEVATHGTFHQRLIDLTPDQFREDLRRSVQILQGITGVKPIGYRAPEWTVARETLWAFDILVEEGFLYDSSTVPLSCMGDRALPRWPHKVKCRAGEILEFPSSTMRCLWENFPFTGGLPMRMSPYFFIVEGIKKANRIGYPAMVYTHPWEFDENPPKLDLPFRRRFMSQYLRRSTPRKVEALMARFRFGPIREVLGIP